MWIFITLASLALILLVLVDSFETTVQPRRVTHRFRFARLFYRSTWSLWRALALWIPPGKTRISFISLFGPMSLLGLLVTWVLGLIFGFALLHWSIGTTVEAPEGRPDFWSYLYWSGGTFFTLGPGDIRAIGRMGRFLCVAEAGLGFGFLALIIGYLPVIYQTFSRREVMISLMDARAGSPPSAAQLLLRLARSGKTEMLDPLLSEWEHWAAEVLESHLSFPLLTYYRSQHDNQSWLAALTSILDTCAFMIVQVKCNSSYQAQLTFAMARHTVVDLALIFKTTPIAPEPDRLPSTQLQALLSQLREAGLELTDGPNIERHLAELRGMYEPIVNALAQRFLFTLPSIMPEKVGPDNWQTSAWMPRAPGIGSLPLGTQRGDHFE
jgi:hypothetical protein